MGTPSALEQYMIELINRARLDPEGEADRYGINLNAGLSSGTISTSAKQPLVSNAALDSAALDHSQWMLSANQFSHTGSGGSSPWQRITSAGYNNYNAAGENIAWSGRSNGYEADIAAVDRHHSGLFQSAGHRKNIMNNSYEEIGVGIAKGKFGSWFAHMTTENFGSKGTGPFLTGVAFNDADKDGFYTPGEGLGAVAITITPETGSALSASTMSAGGYGKAVGAGTYTITFTQGGQSVSGTVDVAGDNVKIDFVDGDTLQSSADLQLGAGAKNGILLGVANLSLDGNSGPNLLEGNKGKNLLIGKAGADTMKGGLGNDTLKGGGQNDKMYGEEGKDVLRGGWGNDFLYGGSGNDTLRGGKHRDDLHGGDDNDNLQGHGGEDTLAGDGGNDLLHGGNHKDELSGGLGADTLTGGNSDDIFYFNEGDGADRITDFKAGQGSDDSITLSVIGVSSFDQVLAAANPHAEGTHINFGGGDSLLLVGVNRDQLHGDDFSFI